MNSLPFYRCEVCQSRKTRRDWFLVTEVRHRDTLNILKWEERLAQQPGMHCLCSAAHVQDLVSHWMLTGSLDYRCSLPASAASPPAGSDKLDACFRLGELMLDRSSFSALGEHPEMMRSILEALDIALQDGAGEDKQKENGEEESALVYDA